MQVLISGIHMLKYTELLVDYRKRKITQVCTEFGVLPTHKTKQ